MGSPLDSRPRALGTTIAAASGRAVRLRGGGSPLTIQAGKVLKYPSKPVPGGSGRDPVAGEWSTGEAAAAVRAWGCAGCAEDFGLVPVEYPTTRQVGADPHDRARDVMAAFADPSIKAVMASIGGADPDPDPAAPRPWRDRRQPQAVQRLQRQHEPGSLYLWNSGIVGYYGGSVMYHLGRPGALHPPVDGFTARRALHERRIRAERGNDLARRRQRLGRSGDVQTRAGDGSPFQKAGSGTTRIASPRGITWGGCFDVLTLMAIADREIASPEDVQKAASS